MKVAIDPAAAKASKPAGLLVVSYDNKAGANEALIVTPR